MHQAPPYKNNYSHWLDAGQVAVDQRQVGDERLVAGTAGQVTHQEATELGLICRVARQWNLGKITTLLDRKDKIRRQK